MKLWMPLVACAAAAMVLAACGGSDNKDDSPGVGAVQMKVLSSTSDYVSGGDARVEFSVDPALQAKLEFWLNGKKISPTLVATGDRLQGLLSGLAVGPNLVEARYPRDSGTTATYPFQLVNAPISGPVFSGPRLTPFECRTAESGLGAPLDADCSATTRFDYFYFTTASKFTPLADPLTRPADLATTVTSEGKTVPYIVRVESGTINRSIYRIAVLDDPKVKNQWVSTSWNKRMIFTIGESTGAQYHQGVNQVTDVLGNTAAQLALSGGYAQIISTQNVNKLNPNDVLSAEGMMMIKEHFNKAYGVPRWMVGYGGSGGAIQQMLIAQNYPGLMDGILPNAAFPDVIGTMQAVSDCRLLNRYFTANPASDAVRMAFEGFAKSTCATWDKGNGDAIVADGGTSNGCGVNDKTLVYNATTNRKGARCTVHDVNANSLGRDATTGFARRPLDNIGVQYGLVALRNGSITTTQFLDINERVGGYDVDGNLMAARTAGDTTAIRNAYELGRVGSGAGGLATTPIMHARVFAEVAGDIHTAYNDVQIREKLLKANGRFDNQVVWVLPHPQLPLFRGGNAADVARVTAFVNAVIAQQFSLMVQWLDAITGDTAPLTANKIAKYKPMTAADACWGLDGVRHDEAPTLATANVCNGIFPKGLSPRLVAGGPNSDDILKCQQKPVADADYLPAVFSAAEKTRLNAIFPTGVCDYSKTGVGQVPLRGTWLKY